MRIEHKGIHAVVQVRQVKAKVSAEGPSNRDQVERLAEGARCWGEERKDWGHETRRHNGMRVELLRYRMTKLRPIGVTLLILRTLFQLLSFSFSVLAYPHFIVLRCVLTENDRSMIAREYVKARRKASEFFEKAGIVLTPDEKKDIEIADFGLGDLTHTGLQIVTYINTERYCAKELALFPRQTCPEHLHPDIDGELGKEETFRCRWGTVYLHVPGKKTPKPQSVPPAGRESSYTVYREVTLKPGFQYTIRPNTLHWFQAGDEGAIVSEFSSRSRDENDVFTDPDIVRVTRLS